MLEKQVYPVRILQAAMLASLVSNSTADSVRFVDDRVYAYEGDRVAYVTVERVDPSEKKAAVRLRAHEDTAKRRKDYRGRTKTLKWGKGESGPKTWSIRLRNDRKEEGNESFFVEVVRVRGTEVDIDDLSCEVSIITLDGDGLPSHVKQTSAFKTHKGTMALNLPSGSTEFNEGGSSRNVDRSRTVAGIGDVDGDGYEDFAIGEPGEFADGYYENCECPECVAGWVWIVFGNDALPSDLNDTDENTLRIFSPDSACREDGLKRPNGFGSDVMGAGDLNGDGYSDFAVTAPLSGGFPGYNHGPGSIHVIFGGEDFRTRTHNLSLPDGVTNTRIDGDGTLGDIFTGQPLGMVAGPSERLQDSGLPSLIVGYSGTFFNRIDGIAGAWPAVIDLAELNTPEPATLLSETRHVSIEPSGIGDFDGDGYGDYAVGAFALEGEPPKCVIRYGGPSALDRTTSVYVQREYTDTWFVSDRFAEQAAGVGDINGDGHTEVVIAGGKSVWLVFGHGNPEPVVSLGDSPGNPAPPLSSNHTVRIWHQSFWPGRLSDHNTSVSPAGDVNGDGLADFLLGFRSSTSFPQTGLEQIANTYLVLGGSIDPNVTDVIGDIDDWIDAGAGSRGSRLMNYGGSSDVAGDVDGDGLSEFLATVRRDSVIDHEATLFSWTESPVQSATVSVFVPNGNAPAIPMGTTGTGRERYSWARCALDFSGGWSNRRPDTSLEKITLHRGTEMLSNLPLPHADVSWHLESERTNFGELDIELKYLDTEIPFGLSESEVEVLHATTPDGPWRRLPTTRLTEQNIVVAALPEVDSGSENWFALGKALQGAVADCGPDDSDCDGVDDQTAIDEGLVSDCNENGIPDRSETNRALQFDGVDDWLDGGMHPDFRLNGDFVVSLRINVSGSAPRDETLPVIVKGGSNTDDFEYSLSAVTAELNYYTLLFELTNANGDTYRILDTRSADIGPHLVYDRWYHIAVLVRRDNTFPFGEPYVSFFLNGRQAATCISDTLLDCPTPGLGTAGEYPLFIGRWPNAGLPTFEGMLDDITLWNGAKSSSFILNTLVPSNQTGSESDLAAWLRFDRDRDLQFVRNEKSGADSNFAVYGSPRVVPGPTVRDALSDNDGDGSVDACGDCISALYRNPVRDGFPATDFADPMITWFRGEYLLSGTTGFSRGHHAWTSNDLLNWSYEGLVLDTDKVMIWQGHWSGSAYYSGDLIALTNPDGSGRYYMSYSAGGPDDLYATGIGLATSSSSLLSFEPPVAAELDPKDRYGPGNIYDGNFVFDNDGTPFMIMSLPQGGTPPIAVELRPVLRQLTDDLLDLEQGTSDIAILPQEDSDWLLATFARDVPETIVAGGRFSGPPDFDLFRQPWHWEGTSSSGEESFLVETSGESSRLRIDWGAMRDSSGSSVRIESTAPAMVIATGTAISHGTSIFEFDPVSSEQLRVVIEKTGTDPATVVRAQAFSTDRNLIGFGITADSPNSEAYLEWSWKSGTGQFEEFAHVDLLEEAMLDEVRVFWDETPAGTTYDVLVSKDNKVWTMVAENQSASMDRGIITRFAPAIARYLRIDISKVSGQRIAIHRIEAIDSSTGVDRALYGNPAVSSTADALLIMESQAIFRENDRYYMLFAGDAFYSHNYSIGYASAPSLSGPWTMAPENPIGTKKFHSGIVGPGVCDSILSPDGTERWGVYHAFHAPYGPFGRNGRIDRFGFRKDGSLFIMGPTTLPQVAPSDAPNLSLRATMITAASEQQTAERVADGDENTAWLSGDTTPQTLTIDLGDLYNTKSLIIDWDPTRFAREWSAEVSTDGMDWVEVVSRTAGTNQYLRYPFAAARPARYVRVFLSKPASGADAFGIRELEVRGEGCALVDADANALIVESEKGPDHSLTLDLRGICGIEGIRLPEEVADSPALELSADGAHFRSVETDATPGDGYVFLHLDSSIPARFVRVSANSPVTNADVYALPRRLEAAAVAGTVTASENMEATDLAFDGDGTTGWSATAEDAWIGLDSGRPRTVRGIDIQWVDGKWPKAFDLMASEDGIDFFPVTGLINDSEPEANALVETAPVTAQYWRIQLRNESPTTCSLARWSLLVEIEQGS